MKKHKKEKTYSVFGAGAAGLYSAWRLLSGESNKLKEKDKLLSAGDTLELFDWGKYVFSDKEKGTREAGARVCTWFYKDETDASYLELGGMRYSYWDGTPKGQGHRLVTKTIEELELDQYSVPFNEASDPLLSLRAKNMYTSDINANAPAPYNASGYSADTGPDEAFTKIEAVGVDVLEGVDPPTRNEWCKFYEEGRISEQMSESSIYQKGDYLKNIGYWNLAYDVLGQEGFSYLADGNGYSSNVVNSNSAQSFEVNNEFTPGTLYKTLTTGYSSMFSALFQRIEKLAKEKGIHFKYHPNTRLRSILERGNVICYTLASKDEPDKELNPGKKRTTDAAFMAMGRHAVELVAQATRYMEKDKGDFDVLNHEKVQLYLESVLMQPSYKIGMFFDTPWWRDDIESPPKYPSKLNSYFLTEKGLDTLGSSRFPAKYIKAIEVAATKADLVKLENVGKKKKKPVPPTLVNTSYDTKVEFLSVLEFIIQAKLNYTDEQLILNTAHLDTIGPSATDMPIRQVVYFGDNSTNGKAKKVYGILASYDDIRYTTFWKALELGPKGTRKIPESKDVQPLNGPRKAPPVMVKMLRQQLASLHFGPQADYSAVPAPLETKYMDWSLPPFKAGYHAYYSHYNIGDVQQKIRKPSTLIKGKNTNIFIIGSTYSNDQAWVEGAYCTAESVLNSFFNIKPIIDEKNYPFICPE